MFIKDAVYAFKVPSNRISMRIVQAIKNHFLLLKLISPERLSTLHCNLHCNKRDGISSLIYNSGPPPLSFLSHLYGVVKPILNWAEGKKSSSFVPEMRKMSTFLSSIYTKESNLFLIKFMFTYTKITLLGKQIFISIIQVLASQKSAPDFDRPAILG